ncbi:MAG: hypothetical protein HYV51_02825 [Parcubacteria group bacterium]|nr:hypothetical protein [Parcubacteria group bacterium]
MILTLFFVISQRSLLISETAKFLIKKSPHVDFILQYAINKISSLFFIKRVAVIAMVERNRLIRFLNNIWGLILILTGGAVLLIMLALSFGVIIVWFFTALGSIAAWLPILLAKLLGIL